jgi:hypothetical protein
MSSLSFGTEATYALRSFVSLIDKAIEQIDEAEVFLLSSFL